MASPYGIDGRGTRAASVSWNPKARPRLMPAGRFESRPPSHPADQARNRKVRLSSSQALGALQFRCVINRRSVRWAKVRPRRCGLRPNNSRRRDGAGADGPSLPPSASMVAAVESSLHSINREPHSALFAQKHRPSWVPFPGRGRTAAVLLRPGPAQAKRGDSRHGSAAACTRDRKADVCGAQRGSCGTGTNKPEKTAGNRNSPGPSFTATGTTTPPPSAGVAPGRQPSIMGCRNRTMPQILQRPEIAMASPRGE